MKKSIPKSLRHRKLVLDRETIAILTSVHLSNVVGGTYDSDLAGCQEESFQTCFGGNNIR